MRVLLLIALAGTVGCAVAQVSPPRPLPAASPSPALATPLRPLPPLTPPSDSLVVIPPLESPPLPPALLPNNTAPTAQTGTLTLPSPAAAAAAAAAAGLAAAIPSRSPAEPSPSPVPAVILLPSPSPPARVPLPASAAIASPSQLPSPSPEAEPILQLPYASPSSAPLALEETESPIPAATNATAAPQATDMPASPPVAATAANPKTASTPAAAGSATAVRADGVTYIDASPLFVLQSTPRLAALAKLGKGTSFNKILADKQLLATIFAPNNEAVEAAVAYLESSSNMTAAELKEQGIVDQLLRYHVAEGAALLSSALEANQVVTMLDGNKTKITIEGTSARRLLATDRNRTIFINSDSQQQAQVVGGSIQAGSSIIHTIDAVLIPQALLDDYKLATKGMPGYVPGAVGVAPSSTAGVTPQSSVVVPAPGRSSAHSAVAAYMAIALPVLVAVLLS